MSDSKRPAAGQSRPDGDPTEPTEDLSSTTSRPSGPTALRMIMSSNFLEYASYVIKERAIPHVDDGLKPVQRRILHTLWELDDGKFHKVANVVGSTMRYHPHGDASIFSALVHLANKDFFIDRQGNFGNIFTGDGPSAQRYIECRLSPLAREVLFNPEITAYQASYDGRNKEPLCLPAKVPVLLLQGTEGIAVGMSTRVLPHNFRELLTAQIAIIRNQPFTVYPDFLQGGLMDVSEYENGNGRVRLRARMDTTNDKTIVIREIPATTTTESLIASIEDAVGKGKLKIAAITDYTAEKVEIEIKLPRNTHASQTVKALYAYTDCEISVSCNCLVIKNERPETMTVSAVLEHNTAKLLDDLRRELELLLGKLNDQFHAKTLVQIFIENRIYKRIEACETSEAIFAEVRTGLEPFVKQLPREVTDDDIEMLLRIPIRRISLFDINRNKQEIGEILEKIDQARYDLAHLDDYAVAFLEAILQKHGKERERRTTIRDIESVDVRKVALTNVKVGVDRAGGYVGTAVKSDEPIACTEFDKLVILKHDGTFKVIAIPEKLYVGPFCAVMKVDREQVYCMIYRERTSKLCYAKRFRIDRFIANRDYATIPKGCRIEKFLDRYGIVMRCEFEPSKRQRTDHCMLEFDTLPVRGHGAKGTRVARKPIIKFLQVKRGSETPPEAAEAAGKGNDDATPTATPPPTPAEPNRNSTADSAPPPAADEGAATARRPPYLVDEDGAFELEP